MTQKSEGISNTLARKEREREDRQFFGRLVDREKVDIRLLRTWLRRCKAWHQDICEEDGVAGGRLPDNLRLIDVEKRRIVKAPGDKFYYLTLSYVWGKENMMQETGMTRWSQRGHTYEELKPARNSLHFQSASRRRLKTLFH